MSAQKLIVDAALAARTTSDAQAVQALIAADVGETYQRPLGDRWSNVGLITRSGNADHKLIELVTNAQDAVLELLALQRFGPDADVPYRTPHEAANGLLGHLKWQQAAGLVNIGLHPAGGPPRDTGRLTPVFRDQGCGMTPAYVPQSLFYLGTRHKGKAAWQQGAFGVGGASTFRHADAVVLVTRRHPDLLAPGEEDRITVAVCLWDQFEKGSGLYYLVTSNWDHNNNAAAEPWSMPANEYPSFEPGTHLALVAYEPERIHKAAMGGEWSFEKMLNARLFRSVMPVRVENHISAKAHPQNYRGLSRQFEENPRKDRKELGPELLPFHLKGETYQLPISAYYFEAGKGADVGGKRGFVNSDHALMFISNGQVHHHWNIGDLRRRTKLKHIHDRTLIVVELDELPIQQRNWLVSPERQGFVDSDDTRRLQLLVAEFLDDWDELVDFDREVLRRAIAGDRSGRSTINIARQIGRALQFKGGFRLGGSNNGNGAGKKKRKKLAKADLYVDPTTIEGPQSLSIEQGATRMTRFHINAKDKFAASGRGTLVVTCDHPDLGDREITVGTLHGGFARVVIAVPDTAALGDYRLTASVVGWSKSSGGVGADLIWDTALKITAPVSTEGRKQTRRNSTDEQPTNDGDLVALIWKNGEEFEDWHAGVPGHVEPVEASILAEDDDYKDLAALGDTRVPTIFLNRDYSALKRYESARAHELTERGLDDARDRYAVGVGLGLLLLDRDLEAKDGAVVVSREVELAAKQAAAQATLVMMPQYDRLAREVGVDD